MSKVYAVLGGSSPNDIVTCDESAAMAVVRFKYQTGGWTARTVYIQRYGERLIDITGSRQAVSALTGMPASTMEGCDPLAKVVATNNQLVQDGNAVNGSSGLFASFPIVDADNVAANIGRLFKGDGAGKLTLCTAATDTPVAVLAALPDAGKAGAQALFCLQGVCMFKGMATGPAQFARIVLAAGVMRVALAADLSVSAGAGNPVTGARAVGIALAAAANDVDFLGYFLGAGGAMYLT